MLLSFGLLIVCCSLCQGQIPPDITEFAQDRTGKVTLDDPGDLRQTELSLYCKTDGSTPMTFSWKHNDNPLVGQRGIRMTKYKPNEELLEIRGMSPTDNGKYQCFAENVNGRTFSSQLPVRLTYVADFKEDNTFVKDVDVVLGQPLRLVCPEEIDRSNNFGEVRFWARRKGSKLENLKPKNNRVIMPNGDLLFLYLNQSDIDDIRKLPDGTVQCVAQAGYTIYYSHQFKLKVTKTEKKNFGPTFQGSDASPKAEEHAIQGKSKKLFCAAVGYPAPSITWYRLINKQKKKIEHGKDGFSLREFGRELSIDPVSLSQHEDGHYQCEASNNGGSVMSALIKLKVFVPPKWTLKPPKVLSIPVQSDSSLKCEALGIPTPTYKWYHNGTAFKSDDELGPDIKVDGQYLRFLKMKRKNYGLFQCVAKNDYGMQVSSSWVKFKDTEKPFQVTCHKDSMKIALKSSAFGDGNFKTDTATLKDTNCKAQRLNNTHDVYMETPLDGCGTYHNYSSDGRYVIYYNHIALQRKSDDDSALITRDHEAVFEFECRYHRTMVLSVVHFTPARAIVYTATENFGNFTFMMRMFKTKQYKEPYDKYPVNVITNQDMFIQTDVKAKDADLVLFVEKCTVTPSKDRNDKQVYNLIEKGCAKDKTLKYDHKLSSVQRFNFKAFYFKADKQATVHIHCTVRVCRKADKNSRCVKGCSSRRRRAAPDANEENEISGTLTLGPIQRPSQPRKGFSTASDSSSPKMFVEIVVGVLGFFVVVLLVAVMVVLFKSRRQKQQKREALSLMVIDNSDH